eukprot:gene15116-20337_t
MGGGISMTGKVEDKELEVRDERRRNSLAFYISEFVSYDDDNYTPLIEAVKADKLKNGGKATVAKVSKFGKIAEAILQGNMKELRNQVVVYFQSINRNYKDQYVGNTLLHFACQEGYYAMLTFMANPANRADIDKNELDPSPMNDRQRIPLFLCFTPPVATYSGLKYGVNSDGTPLAEKPPDIQASDWVLPGGPKSRENCIKFLLEKGVDPNTKDFHNYTALHYAAMWAVEYNQIAAIKYLLTVPQISLEVPDSDGYTALLMAVEQKTEEGMEIA